MWGERSEMQIKPFQIERYFARYEFEVPYLLSASDCESLSMQALLEGADPEALALWRGLSLGYTDPQGHSLLRQEVARLYQNVSADEVQVLAPEEGIFIAMHALLEPGDHVIVTFPGYQSLYEIARALGCHVTRWTLQPKGDRWELDLDELERSILLETKLLVVNFPHNPTGYLPTPATWARIVELARERELYLFSDEMYAGLEYEPAQRLPPVCDLYERGISLSGLSKTLSCPGLRIGWLATQDRVLRDRFATLRDYTTICSSAPSEILALIALRAREAIVARNLAIIRCNLEVAQRFFDANADGFEWRKPQAGSVAFPRLTTGVRVEAFCQDLLERGVMALPGTVFEFPGDYFRLGLGRENLPQALERVSGL